MQSDQSTRTRNRLHHYGFPKLVHSARLEQLGDGLAVCSGEMVTAHWVDEPVAEASAFGSLVAVPESTVAASGMDDVVHALVDKPCSGF
jgi:hypothetical protein